MKTGGDSGQSFSRDDGGTRKDQDALGKGTPIEQAELRAENAEAQARALGASELSYRRLFESARDGILILDVETGRIVDVNPFLVELLGFSRDGMVGKTVGELSPFKDVVANRAMLERLQKDGYVRYEDLPLETRDGRHIAVEFVSNVYQAGNEKVIQCNIRDITGRKQAEAAMIASEVRYRRLFETAKDGILILNAETGKIVDVNPFLIELLGSSRENILGEKIWELGFFKDIIANEARFSELQQKEYIRYEDMALEAADGRRVEVEFVSNVYLVNHHKVIQCNIRDISERKRAEAALQGSEEQFRAMFEVASIGMSQTDPQTGQWLRVNRKLCDITGYSADELLRMRFSEITHPDDRLADWEAFQQVVRGEVPDYRIEKRYLRKDGTEVWVNVNMSLMRDAGGQPVRTMTTIEDITARRRAEVMLAQQMDELRRWQAVMLGREGRVGALKREVNALAVRLGQPPPYGTPEDGGLEKNG